MAVQSLIANGYNCQHKVDKWGESASSPIKLYAGKIGSQGWLDVDEEPQDASHLFQSEY